MAARILNIEVGDRLTKVCCSIPTKKGGKIQDSFMFRTPEGAVSDGMINDVDSLAAALSEDLSAHGLGSVKNVAFAVSSGKIASREVKLPPVKDKQIASVIATNASEYFPIDLSGYHVTHCLLEKVNSPEKQLRVLVLAAPVSLLSGYLELAKKTGLTVKTINSGGNSHYQALRGIKEAGVTMYVDVDCTGSYVSFINNGQLLLQRTFAFGGDELISRYMQKYGMYEDRYVEALEDLSSYTPDSGSEPPMSEEEIDGDLGRLVGSIVRSADYFNSNRWDIHVSRIVLMGPCAKLIGLRELISANTGLPTLNLEELPGITSVIGSGKNAGFYISCIGAAVRPVNLIPDSLDNGGAKTPESRETLGAALVIFIVLIAAAVGLSAFAVLNYIGAKRELDDINKEIDDLSYAEDVYLSYLSYQQGQAALNLITSMSDNPNADLVAFYEELEKKMPSSILLLSAVCTNEGVSMNITVADYTDTAAVLSELRGFESLASVDVGSITRSVNEGGVERVAFSVNCTYGINPYLNGINPYGDLIAPETDAQ